MAKKIKRVSIIRNKKGGWFFGGKKVGQREKGQVLLTLKIEADKIEGLKKAFGQDNLETVKFYLADLIKKSSDLRFYLGDFVFVFSGVGGRDAVTREVDNLTNKYTTELDDLLQFISKNKPRFYGENRMYITKNIKLAIDRIIRFWKVRANYVNSTITDWERKKS